MHSIATLFYATVLVVIVMAGLATVERLLNVRDSVDDWERDNWPTSR